jgi:2-methylcitrate dehydratase PrpD
MYLLLISRNARTMSDHPVEQLAGKVCATVFSDFSAATVAKTRLHILDTLGVALAGSASAETGIVLDALGLRADVGRAAVWGLSCRLNPRAASFVNGVSAHAFELDDSGGCDHSGAVVLPAALAILPVLSRPVSGAELIRSVIMGYEVGRRVLEACGGYEKHNGLGWHSTGTCGVFGAATSVALLLGMNQEQLATALGIACSYAGGTWGFIHDGSQTKKLHPGRAAEGGLSAALLAGGGFQGPRAVFDANAWGSFFGSFSPGESDPSCLTSDFGRNWRLNRCSIKPYATCRGTHSAIDAIQELMASHALTAGQIDRIEVAMSPFQYGMCGAKSVATRAEAQMSLPYALAARLHFGKVGLAELEAEAWQASEIGRWLQCISVKSDASMNDEDEPEITIITREQQRYSLVVEFPLGGPANPLPDDRLIAKFEDLSAGVLPDENLKRLRAAVLSLDDIPDVRSLTGWLCR